MMIMNASAKFLQDWNRLWVVGTAWRIVMGVWICRCGACISSFAENSGMAYLVKEGVILQVNHGGNEFQERSKRLFSLWGMPELASHVDIQFSRRLRSSLGRTRVDTHRVRLNPLLGEAGNGLLEEVLCHELAHIAVYERFGANVKPHGSEWANLVQQAGYKPRLSAVIHGERQHCNQLRFEHLCPVCQVVRYAKRPMTSWRCSGCVDAGLEGLLLIRNFGKE